MEQELKVKLPIYEGPLDLLLSLIQKNKIDIYDIPIAFITRQYLEYLAAWTKELNVDIASEFLVMAATLIHIKSRMLLPVERQDALDEDEDPRLELVQRLLSYQSFKEAALLLKEKESFGETCFYRDPQWIDEDTSEVKQSLFSVDLYVLLRAFSSLIDKKPVEARLITRESLTLKDKIAIIMERLEIEKEITFYDIFEETDDKVDMIVSFLALLEILRLGLACVFQEQYFGEIKIVKR
ncbi:MAG: segregation/condensation protein A [Nitrospirae bacterium]|nr:segregation/condensation protein A [Nitrospirota bacterium]